MLLFIIKSLSIVFNRISPKMMTTSGDLWFRVLNISILNSKSGAIYFFIILIIYSAICGSATFLAFSIKENVETRNHKDPVIFSQNL